MELIPLDLMISSCLIDSLNECRLHYWIRSTAFVLSLTLLLVDRSVACSVIIIDFVCLVLLSEGYVRYLKSS